MPCYHTLTDLVVVVEKQSRLSTFLSIRLQLYLWQFLGIQPQHWKSNHFFLLTLPLLGNPRGQNWGDLTRMRTEPNPHKGMTPPSTQNLKALGLWVFFLICCSTFSFLLNVGLRLTLGYLKNLPLKWESLPQ